jgi:hypothetical protein
VSRKNRPKLPRVRSGDEITPRHFNEAYDAISRLQMSVAGDFAAYQSFGFVALTTSQVSARVGDTLGKGPATVYRLYRDGDNVRWVASITGRTIYNTSTGIIGSGRFVQLKRINGFLVIDVDHCDTPTSAPPTSQFAAAQFAADFANQAAVEGTLVAGAEFSSDFDVLSFGGSGLVPVPPPPPP